jgi:hypothetical protein
MTALYEQKYDQELVARLFEIAGKPTGDFKPFAFHNTAGDCIECFVSQGDYFAERVDNYLTLYLAEGTDEIIGFVIKNVKRIINRIAKQKSAMAFVIGERRANLRCLFYALFVNETPDQEDRHSMVIREYQKVVEIAETNELSEVELVCV